MITVCSYVYISLHDKLNLNLLDMLFDWRKKGREGGQGGKGVTYNWEVRWEGKGRIEWWKGERMGWNLGGG